MSERENERKACDIFNPSIYLELLPTALLIQAQIEGEERAERKKKAEDFVRRYPSPPRRSKARMSRKWREYDQQTL